MRAHYASEKGKKQQQEMRAKFKKKRTAANATYNARRYGEHGKLDAEFLNSLHKWQDHCCIYCNVYLDSKETIEHLVPLKRGGTNLPHNVALACTSCNSSKSDRLLDEWRPAAVQQIPRLHAQFMTQRVAEKLRAAGLTVEDRGDRLLVAGRTLFVLSSFWLAERFSSPPAISALIEAHPGAVFTFDFEWLTRPDALLNSVLAKTGLAKSIGARELTVAAPSSDEARLFLDRWHTQGFSSGAWYVGLRTDEGEWRGMCSVSRQKGGAFMLSRVAFRGHVAGGLSRMLKAVKDRVGSGGLLLTYADSRLSDGDSYKKTGFEQAGKTVPSFHVANATGLYHWNAYTKTALSKKVDFFDSSWPLWRLYRANGLWRVDDAPLHRFVLRA